MKTAIIGGTGVQHLPGWMLRAERALSGGVYLYEGALNGEAALLLPRHSKGHKTPPHRIPHAQHVRILKEHGVQAVLATAAVGSLRADWNAGTIVILSDFLDFMREVNTLYHDAVVHTDFTTPFSPLLRDALLQAAQQLPIAVQPEGVYVCAPGPRYETPAEIRMFRMLGGDVIGMTVAPEAILCREAGIHYAAVSVVTNLGAGLSEYPLTHEEVTQVMQQASTTIAQLFTHTLRILRATPL
ncbi:MAG: methylthioadenosine phosphorylase [Fimbriimonadales bacterium]|nr:MAG: methylthioadenosine phosphorylase [Fimbriimonadales bacterium]GIV10970.1 MAG: methylthioadenosine phosphorylase [Fimbriimonadales bacterium]